MRLLNPLLFCFVLGLMHRFESLDGWLVTVHDVRLEYLDVHSPHRKFFLTVSLYHVFDDGKEMFIFLIKVPKDTFAAEVAQRGHVNPELVAANSDVICSNDPRLVVITEGAILLFVNIQGLLGDVGITT